jgi:hypothetical protein
MSDKDTIAISTESREKLRDILEDRDCTAKTAIEQLIQREHRHISSRDLKEEILLHLHEESDLGLVKSPQKDDYDVETITEQITGESSR